MPTNLYELIIKTLNKTDVTLKQAYLLAQALERVCEDVTNITIKVDDESFRIISCYSCGNNDIGIYYEEEHTVAVFTDGTIGEIILSRESLEEEMAITTDSQGTIAEYLKRKLPSYLTK